MFSRTIAGSILALWSTFVFSSGVQFAGVNIAGFDFGCDTSVCSSGILSRLALANKFVKGNCVQSNVQPPLGTNGGGDGPGQMAHFSQNDKFNIFRLPVGWQYLQDSLGATLNAGNAGTYDQLVQACLKTGAHCIIDIHNYARWNGAIIGQSGGPTNDQFANLWSQLAKKYAGDANVVMGLMNEPHDSKCLYLLCFFILLTSVTVPDINSWSQAVQAAVTAIRTAGATEQLILLPGNSYTSAGSFVSTGSAAALNSVKDSDGTTSKLIFDVHNYFDSDGSGTNPECTSNKIADGFQPLVSFLQSNNRQALVTELGGGSSTQSCLTDICQALDFLNANSDVYLGWVGWAAGSFASSYPLSLLPSGSTDVPLVTQCFAGKFQGGSGNSNATMGGGNNTGTTNSSSPGNGPGAGQPGSGNVGSSGQAPTAPIVQPPYPTSGTPGTPLATGAMQSSNNETGTYQPLQSQPQQSPAGGSGSECNVPSSRKMRRETRRRDRAAMEQKIKEIKEEFGI